jgi:tripartite-type tricarboxylate transporter receptor subunit TctC
MPASFRSKDQMGFARQLTELGADPLESTPAEFAGFIIKEMERWRTIVRDLDLSAGQ